MTYDKNDMPFVYHSMMCADMKIEADLVVFNGNIITMDPQKPTAAALAVKSYKVLTIGEEQEVLDLVPTAKRVIDLGGKTVVPGFIDAHTHQTI